MNELNEKISELLEKLDSDKRIIRVRNINEKIKLDNEFCLLIDEYKNSYGKGVKLLIDEHPLYLEYLESERDVNLLIEDINLKLSNIYMKKNCSKCGGCNEDN